MRRLLDKFLVWLLGKPEPSMAERLTEFLDEEHPDCVICEVSAGDYCELIDDLEQLHRFLPRAEHGGFWFQGYIVRPNTSLHDGKWRVW